MSTESFTEKAQRFWQGRTLWIWGIKTELITQSNNDAVKATITYRSQPISTAHSDFIPPNTTEIRPFEEQAIERAIQGCPPEPPGWDAVIA